MGLSRLALTANHLLSLDQQQRRRMKRSLDAARSSFQNRSPFGYGMGWREEWEFRTGREEYEEELPSTNTDLTYVLAMSPEETFVDKGEDVPERYFGICG
ncbi:hypothetical protein K435DRAFT_867582 [Dendrothele bispora CBS 962.96]|uniref:Uncharacterized protein n=1 Tax=Dendrothele bispora (strain CBS 962.96) TaxID=1314807 RepID=A0A4S8LDZ3_DENBC|nr:hypothetical protein K435DRAFT_867582 [Dendrothele bispora CBS 962.96]